MLLCLSFTVDLLLCADAFGVPDGCRVGRLRHCGRTDRNQELPERVPGLRRTVHLPRQQETLHRTDAGGMYSVKVLDVITNIESL